ncbi:MAG: serine/threonine protein kinase [Gammaproteobacteria bacterium]|nr:serine/threonine protein kinase [Gammaproteobacteria bacterium]MBU1725260.1 serine/threonine protein kinase [Gammaproteobacteria bacterium]MBU2005810.1 serine/threonine protein kinase [Gammaproteobacteria bacterium]
MVAADSPDAGNHASVDDSEDDVFRLQRLRHYLHQFPLSLPGLTFSEVLHDSDNAVIFLAENADGLTVAVKRFKFDARKMDVVLLEYFLLATRALGLLGQRSLVRLLDAGVEADAIYMVMEYIRGETLKHYLDGETLPPLAQRLDWFGELVDAVGGMHSLGLLHRDLKTSNILVREDGSLVLLDFGMETRLLLEAGFLQEGEVYCTPYYISPERIMGEMADESSDFYALGVILYELLTGHKPYESLQLEELLKKHVLAPIPELPDNLRAFQPLIDGLLAKFSENRLQSSCEVVRLLHESREE